jgi:hypothetical protein
MAALPPLGNPNEKLAQALKQLSAAKHGRPKAQVEKEIFERLATKEPPTSPSSSPGPAPLGTQQPPAAPPRRQPGAAGSFMDEWMTKRQSDKPLLRPNPWQKKAPAPNPVQTPAPAPTMPPAATPPSPIDQNTVAPAAPAPVINQQPMTPIVPLAPPANIPQQDTITKQEQDIEAALTDLPLNPIAGQEAAPRIDLPEHPSVSYGDTAAAAVNSETHDRAVDAELRAAAEEVDKKLSGLDNMKVTTPTPGDATGALQPLDTKPNPDTTLPSAESTDTVKLQEPHTADSSTGEIPLRKNVTPKNVVEDSQNDTISIDPDGTLRIH